MKDPIYFQELSEVPFPFSLVPTESTCAGTLDFNQSCRLTFDFHAASHGIHEFPMTLKFLIGHSKRKGQTTLRISGYGAYPGTLVPISGSFDVGTVGLPENKHTVHIFKNTGELPITNLTFSMWPAPAWQFQNECPSELAEGQSCQIRSHFIPQAIGQYPSTVTNTWNDALLNEARIYNLMGRASANEQKIVAQNRQEWTYFGQRMTSNQNWFVASAPGNHYANTAEGHLVEIHSIDSNGDFTHFQTLVGPPSSWFGGALALQGNTLIVGASSMAGGRGRVYVYEFSGGAWNLVQEITAPGADADINYSYFGTSLSLAGTTLVVGAPGNPFDSDGNNFVYMAGATYVFERDLGGQFQHIRKLTPWGTNARDVDDRLGTAVLTNGQQIIIPVCRHPYDINGANPLQQMSGGQKIQAAGAVYIYEKVDDQWNLAQTKLVAYDRGQLNMCFGTNVDLRSDGLLAVGAYRRAADRGAVYLYQKQAAVWTHLQTLSRSDMHLFGASMQFYNDSLVIGAYGTFRGQSPYPAAQVGAIALYKTLTPGSNQFSFIAEFTPQVPLYTFPTYKGWLGTHVHNGPWGMFGTAQYHGWDLNGQNELTYAGAIYRWKHF